MELSGKINKKWKFQGKSDEFGNQPENFCFLISDKVFITLISLKNILIYQGARVMDGGHTMFMNKQYDSSNQEKHYNDDLINGGSETPVAISEPVETQGNLNKEIIKNIAVEKELSEIASAYNLHRNEGDSKTDELIGMDVDPPKDFKDVSESDKSVPSEHLSEGSELDSQDAPINQEDGKSNPKSSEEGVDENSQGTEEASQDSEAKSSKDLEDNSQDAEDNSKDEEDNSKDGEDNSKDGEDNSKDTEATSKDAGEESKDGEDSQDGENSEDVARNIKKEVDEDQDEGDEEEEDDDDDEENIVLSKKLKREVKIEESAQSENGDDSFQDGMCSICKEDLDTSDPPTINKHLSEKHVIVDDDDIKCGVCEKDYAERRGVVRHLLNAHLCYKPHRCDKCSKSFSRKDHLARHKRSHLPPVFECKFCDEDFTKQERLDKHLYKVHSDIFKSGQDDDVVELSGDDDSTVDVPSSDNDNDSDPAPSESGSSDSDSDYETQPRKRGRPPKRKSSRVVKTAAAKRPKRTPPPKRKQIKIQLKASKKSKKEMEADRKKEQEKRKREEEKRKKEAAARKRQKEKMWEEERALERLREREKLRKERAEREAAKEKLLKEELQKRIEEQLKKQKEIDEHYYDGNFIEPATESLKETNNMLDDYSINYTNYYGGNYHEPPKKTLGQLDMERNLLTGFEVFQGIHFLSGKTQSLDLVDASAVAEAKVKAEHIKMINPDSPQGICGLCGEEYNDSDVQALSKHIYEKHIDNASSDKKCAICGKEYSERKGLNRHMLHYHLNYKPHRCMYCPKSFSRKDHLTRHLTQHSDLNRFECEFCQKNFSRKEHLNRHLWVHKDSFKYKCSYCTKAYTREEHLNRHVKDDHLIR
ncbi:hypothetical protein M8J75_009340 [Diaphorina citri]|nr:hypothetical protein M8J75_009340 [Diaphorina citri]